MTAVMVEMRAPVLRLICTKCGAAGSAGCNHGIEFLVKASDRARLEVQKNPGLSNRAIAKKAGVGSRTVDRARPTAPNGAGDRKPLIGKDGKRYKPRRAAPPVDPVQEPCDDCVTPDAQWERSASNIFANVASMRAFWRREFKDWEKFERSSALITLAKQADKEWKELTKAILTRS